MHPARPIHSSHSSEISAPKLSITLLGAFRLTLDGEVVSAPRARTASWILTLLLLRHGQPVDRHWLAETLWHDAEEASALFNLRRNLSELRKMLGSEADRILSPTSRTLQFDLSKGEVSCDLIEFERLTKRGDFESLTRAVDLYRGELLEGCREEWVLPDRTRFEQLYFSSLETLAQTAMAENRPAEAVGWLRRLVTEEPLRESAQRLLFQALAGDRAGMTEAYHRFRRTLHAELNASPAPETVALFERLQKEIPAVIATSPASPPLSPIPPPRYLSTFIGREDEIELLSQRLSAGCRLLTLTGAGGIGKTRLAAAVGERFRQNGDETGWVELASLADAAQILPTIAATFHLSERPGEPLAQKLTEFIGSQSLLLVLDNCEHLLDGAAEWAERLLKACPNLRLLATSRQPLGFFGEENWRVPSLPLPALEKSTQKTVQKTAINLAQLESTPSVRLFTERARAMQHTFSLTEDNAPDIARICARLDGIPLALELAAVWVKSLSVKQIAQRLDDQFALLKQGNRGATLRHQTLQNTMDWSYCALEIEEQRLLARLSVFSGGWTLEAAEAICAASENERKQVFTGLDRLAEKSLVEVEAMSFGLRYRFLEPIRQYAQLRLRDHEANKKTENEAKNEPGDGLSLRHFHFFLERIEQLAGAKANNYLDEIEADYSNYRKAVQCCFSQFEKSSPHLDFVEYGLRLTSALSAFQVQRGYFQEGAMMLATVLQHVDATRFPALCAKARLGAGTIAVTTGNATSARNELQRALDYYEKQPPCIDGIETLRALGNTYLNTDNYSTAQSFFEEALSQCRELGEKSSEARIRVSQGNIAKFSGKLQEAFHSLTAAIQYFQEAEMPADEAIAQHNLGNVLKEWRRPFEAIPHYERSLQIHRRIGNRSRMGINLLELAWIEVNLKNDLSSARSLLEEATDYLRADSRGMYPQCLHLLATLSRYEGNLEEAHLHIVEAVRLKWKTGFKRDLTYSLWETGHQMIAVGQFARCTQLLSALLVIREEMNAPFTDDENKSIHEKLERFRQELSETDYRGAVTRGKQMALEDAVVFALEPLNGIGTE